MVQVDIFWSYALGAGFAIAASKQLVKHEKEDPGQKHGWFTNPYFTGALLYLAVLFAPSGVCLLWAYPSWETMHVWDRNLSAWLVTAFAVTNTTQGVLGFFVTYKLVQSGRRYLGFLQFFFGYFFMFFILVHGWDGSGYQRFFSATKADFLTWKWTNIPAWLISDVAFTLYLMGVILIPVLLYLMGKWIVEGAKENGTESEGKIGTVAKRFLTTVLAGSLGSAIAASILIHLFGWLVGPALFVAAFYFLGLRKGGLIHKAAGRMLLSESNLR